MLRCCYLDITCHSENSFNKCAFFYFSLKKKDVVNRCLCSSPSCTRSEALLSVSELCTQGLPPGGIAIGGLVGGRLAFGQV